MILRRCHGNLLGVVGEEIAQAEAQAPVAGAVFRPFASCALGEVLEVCKCVRRDAAVARLDDDGDDA